ncbi:hypothetical protein C922_02830 [Plasmodium inui San Antonio 1]|uniref:NELL2-like EGF domain-containing protein n=1 Tax=Plasmodium inui San Antonio 1 TaxID=1237626 RepID=W7A512_9APIC|nr:hypothetical protein C922_02830 [Plasmodium inui San Antonio 1]EUD66845.1 hypothetical protein C922_02830 [Plasmodium inui San Antonio 1]
MAISRIVLALLFILLWSYHSGCTLQASLSRKQNANLATQTNRLLKGKRKDHHISHVELSPISGRVGRKKIGMTSNLQLQSGENTSNSRIDVSFGTTAEVEDPIIAELERLQEQEKERQNHKSTPTVTEGAKAEERGGITGDLVERRPITPSGDASESVQAVGKVTEERGEQAEKKAKGEEDVIPTPKKPEESEGQTAESENTQMNFLSTDGHQAQPGKTSEDQEKKDKNSEVDSGTGNQSSPSGHTSESVQTVGTATAEDGQQAERKASEQKDVIPTLTQPQESEGQHAKSEDTQVNLLSTEPTPAQHGNTTENPEEKNRNSEVDHGRGKESSTSSESSKSKETTTEDAEKDQKKVEPNVKPAGTVSPTATEAKGDNHEQAQMPREDQMQMKSIEQNNTNNGNNNKDPKERKEDSKEEGDRGEKGSRETLGNKGENPPEEAGNTGGNTNLESRNTDVEVSEHRHDNVLPEGERNSPDRGTPRECCPCNRNQENRREACDEDRRLNSENLDDRVPPYGGPRNNRVENGIRDTRDMDDIMGRNRKSCSVNNGGCGQDQICIRIDNIGIRCVCKEGHLVRNRCISSNSSSLPSFFSAGLLVLLAMLWMW